VSDRWSVDNVAEDLELAVLLQNRAKQSQLHVPSVRILDKNHGIPMHQMIFMRRSTKKPDADTLEMLATIRRQRSPESLALLVEISPDV
jgi:hypothetical protein